MEMGDEKESERFTGTSLMVTDGRGLANENPALCLRCTPNRDIFHACQRGRFRRCSSVKIHFGKGCHVAILGTEQSMRETTGIEV